MKFKYITSNAEVQEKAVSHFGELFMAILPYLKKPVSAESISKRIKVKPSKIRIVLNRLFNHNLIEYKRSFDDDTGKYTYIWTLNHAKLKEFLKSAPSLSSEVHEKDIASEPVIFVCTGCREHYSFDAATDYSFKCYKCGSFINAIEQQN